MAGFYADVPGRRMALDKDGTQVLGIDSGNNVTTLNSGQISSIVSEANYSTFYTCGQNDSGKLVFFFPELRDLTAAFINAVSVSPSLPGDYWGANLTLFETSTDSTNGIDGTWTTQSMSASNTQTSPAYRTSIVTLSVSGIKAIRMSFNGPAPSFGCNPIVHLYGDIHTGENPNRLAIWQPSTDAIVGPAYFDWGDVARVTTADLTFRVKNLSSALTANTVTATTNSLTDTAPTVTGQHTLSTNGTTFTSSISIGTLAPGDISGVLTLRRITPVNAVPLLWATRLIASAATWS